MSTSQSYTITPVVSNLTVTAGGTQTVTFGGLASYVQLTSQSSQSCYCAINGLSSAKFTLAGNSTQIFNPGDLQITSLTFTNTDSGASTALVQVIYGVIS